MHHFDDSLYADNEHVDQVSKDVVQRQSPVRAFMDDLIVTTTVPGAHVLGSYKF